MKHTKHRIYLILLIFVLLFVYITASRVLSDQAINWKSVSDVGKAVKIYFAWLVDIKDNFKIIAANVVNQDWKLNNESANKGE